MRRIYESLRITNKPNRIFQFKLLVIVIVIVIVGCFVFGRNNGEKSPAAESANQPPQYHYAYVAQKEFYSGIEKPEVVDPVVGKVYGGIVSHHFFVERLIAKFFGGLINQNPKVVVLIGPDHFGAGDYDLTTSYFPYQTPWGVLGNDEKLSKQLVEKGIARNQEKPFEKEHSISTLVGFIKYQFPDALLVPVIVRRNARVEKLNELAENLLRVLPEQALVLASVDFSHHVTNQVAQNQDKESIKILENFDYKKLMKRTSTEIDSPNSLYVLLKYLEGKGIKKMTYTNTNQALVSGSLDSTDVTSYVFATFLK